MKAPLTRVLIAAIALVSAAVAHAAPPQDFVSGSFQSIQAAHRARPFVVALWSLDCTHCKANLDLFARLFKNSRDVDLVLIATDPADARGAVSNTLDKRGLANVESWIFAETFTERLIHEVDPRWHGEVPRTYLFTPGETVTGQTVTALTGRLDESTLEQWMGTRTRSIQRGLP